MSVSLYRKNKPGRDFRTEKQIADDIMLVISRSLDSVDDNGSRFDESIPFPDIPLNKEGMPKRRLTSEEEILLAKRFQALGDVNARNVLAMSQFRFAKMMVKRRNLSYADYDDALQEAMLGIYRAVETFDLSGKWRFNTYCSHWVKNKVNRLFARRRTFYSFNIEGTKEKARVISMDIEYPDGEGDTIKDNIPNDSNPDLDRMVYLSQLSDIVASATEEILEKDSSKRTKDIIYSRYFKCEPDSLEDLGERYGVSRERIRQNQNKISLNLGKNYLRG